MHDEANIGVVLRREAPEPLGHSRSSMPAQIILFYEEQDTWIAHAIANGIAPKIATQLSQWLLDREEVSNIQDALSTIAESDTSSGTVVSRCRISEWLSSFPIDRDSRAKAILWNLTDGTSSFLGSNIINAALMSHIAYFGSPPFAQAIGQDKFKLIALSEAFGVPVARTLLIHDNTVIARSSSWSDLSGPYFVKLNSLGNKVGLSRNSLQASLNEAMEYAVSLSQEYRDRVLVQEFIDGPEIRVTYINGRKDQILGVDRYNFVDDLGINLVDDNLNSPAFVTYRKRNAKYNSYVEFRDWTDCPPDIRENIIRQIARTVEILSTHIRLKDYFALDFRLRKDMTPILIDFNPGAFLCGADVEGYSRSVFSRELAGTLYTALSNSYTAYHDKSAQAFPFRL